MALIARVILKITEDEEDVVAGSAVRKYTSAFAANVTGRRKKTARSVSFGNVGKDSDDDSFSAS